MPAAPSEMALCGHRVFSTFGVAGTCGAGGDISIGIYEIQA